MPTQALAAVAPAPAAVAAGRPRACGGPGSDRLPAPETAQQHYESLSHQQLVSMLMRRDDGIRELRLRAKETRRDERRLEMSTELVLAKANKPSVNAIFDLTKKRGGKGKHLTISGSLALALRTILSSASANRVGLALLEDISDWKVTQSINLLAACIIQSSRMFHARCQADLHTKKLDAFCQGVLRFQISAFSFASDATNAAVWRKSKVHTTEIYSGYLEDVSILNSLSFQNALRCHFVLCDLQRVISGTTEGTYSLLKKQLESVGCPVWPESFPSRPADAYDYRHHWQTQLDQANDSKCIHFKVYMYTADGGGDQKKFKKIASCGAVTDVFTLWVDWPCSMHSGALISKGGLCVTDEWLAANGIQWRFFSATAKIMHVWRDSARNMFAVWSSLLGPEHAVLHAKTLPPAAVSGRWRPGPVGNQEAFASTCRRVSIC
jgi:hypothetical protein